MPRTDIDTAIRDCYNWFVKNAYLKIKNYDTIRSL